MFVRDALALGIAMPADARPEDSAWYHLETDCPMIQLTGSSERGPSYRIEARQLRDNQYFVVQTASFFEDVEDVWMGEIIRVSPATTNPDTLHLDAVEKPLRMAHYECRPFYQDSDVHHLVMELGGEWESVFNGMLFFVHIPIESAGHFEQASGLKLNRLA